MSVRPIIVIACAAFSTDRAAACARLRAELEPQCRAVGVPLFFYYDHAGRGSLQPWLRCLEYGVEHDDVTHVTFLPDDAILVPHFVEVLLAAIEAQPNAILCFQSNHEGSPDAYAQGARWYTTPDGFTAFGGTMPVAWVREHLEWRRTALRDGVLVQGDEGVNTWAMLTGRLIYKSLPSLVDHDLSLKSEDGNDHHAALSARRPLVWEPQADLRSVDWSGPICHLGRTYVGNHWELIWRVKPERWDIEKAYELDRGAPVSTRTKVLIATPAYGGPKLAYLQSVNATIADLQHNGIEAVHLMTSGDSLVTRGRHHLVHEFMRSDCTHLLQWDADIAVQEHDAVRAMLDTGHGIVGCAYPWRDGSGRVVCNPLQGPGSHKLTISNRCTRVADIGTGFLLTRRDVLVDLMNRHPELLYESDFPGYENAPIWAMFDSALESRPNGRKRFASEDWHFCSLARAAGHDVMCYLPPTLRHYGETGHRGHIFDAWKFSSTEGTQ